MDDRAIETPVADPVAAQFPDTAPRLAAWAGRLRALRENRDAAPLESPVDLLANEISAAIDSSEIGVFDLDRSIRALTLKAFLARAARLRRYLGEVDPEKNEQSLRVLIRGLMKDGSGRQVPFETFRRTVEAERIGIVLTAHPTFALSAELTQTLATLAAGRDAQGRMLDPAERRAAESAAARARHGLPDGITLEKEREAAGLAIGHLHNALARLYLILLDEAANAYPREWRALVPRLVTVASWVGFDLDGRNDIRWFNTLEARLDLAARQLARYRDAAGPTDDPEGVLATACEQTEAIVAALRDSDGNSDTLAPILRVLAESADTRFADPAPILESLDAAIEAASDVDALDLAVLRADAANFGTGSAHIHVRLNAAQIHNAVRHDIGFDGDPNQPGQRRRNLAELEQRFASMQPMSVNFGSIMTESMSGRRLFMLVAQFLKHIDRKTPIRFLIAECDSHFTVLAALYLARLFGVADRLDISPLFETPQALRHGHDVIRDLLANEEYRAYLRGRGRLCIQTGYSDAGRYVGQPAAALAVERLRIKVAEALAEADLPGIGLLIFDTHGESIGRGAHPDSFIARLDYIDTPESRLRFAGYGLAVKQELSFQGGDGYALFANPALAFATLTRLVEHALTPPVERPDPFYRETDYSLDFFVTIKEFNEGLIDDPNYATLLGAFGTNLLYPSGSRPSRRQTDSGKAAEMPSPRQLRAIPHNAVLQQMGYLANSLGGVGRAMALDLDRFVEMHEQSPRLRSLVALAAAARKVSSRDALVAYVSLLDPVSWLLLAATDKNGSRREELRRVAEMLNEIGRFSRMNRMLRMFLQDDIDLADGLARADRPLEYSETQADVELLHALRIALIRQIFRLTARLPRFSSRADFTVDDVLGDLLHLGVPSATRQLRVTFPAAAASVDDEAFGEPASYRAEGERGYAREHRMLFDPLDALHDDVRRISVAVMHLMGAVG
ncbi:MAG: phosphoenolpyruvate carboxylase [Dongiaceae bacterium]